MSNPMVDDLNQVLDSVAEQLSTLFEQHLDEEIDDAAYGFALNDLLQRLPTPPAPFHNVVIARIKDWLDAMILPVELAQELRERIKKAAKGSAGAGGSAQPGSSSAAHVPPTPPPQPPPQPPSASPRRSPRQAEKQAEQDAEASPLRSPGQNEKQIQQDAFKKQRTSVQTSLVFGQTMTLSKGSGPLVHTSKSAPMAPTPMAPGGSKRTGSELASEATDVVKTDDKKTLVRVQLRVPAGGTSVAVSFQTKQVKEETALPGVKKKRRTYSAVEKANALAEVAAHAGTSGISSARGKAKALHQTAGYESVQGRQLTSWAKAGPQRKRGPKRNEDFRSAVLDQLIYTQVQDVNSADSVAVLANVAYTYEIIKLAAERVQQFPEYADDAKVQKLKFTHPWIKEFLDSHSLHRRKVSTTEKELLPVPEVQAIMKGIAEEQKKFADDETVSADETGVFYGAQPKNQYVPEGESRGNAPASDEKARYTSMQAGEGKGKMLPSFNIIKCSSTKADLSNTKVLKTLHTQPEFTEADGWVFKIWKRSLNILSKKKEKVTVNYVRPYLYHAETGVVITLQHKAWMDQAGICMWMDLVIGPYYAKKRKKCLLIWDNCGSHCVDAIKPVAEEWGITERKLPKNMTGKLQVMDLMVNGPYKAAIRRERISSIFDYFQSWKIKRLQEMAKDPSERVLPPFAPPKPDLTQGLRNSLKVERELFAKDTFKAGLQRTFQLAGQTPQDDGTFAIYKTHARNTIASHLLPVGKPEDGGSLASLAGDVDVEIIEEDDEPETDEEGADDE